MSFGEGNLHERIEQLEHANKLLSASEQRKIERIEQLESLVRDMYGYAVSRAMELCNACTDANGEYADCAACDEYDGACGIAKRRFEELYDERMDALGLLKGDAQYISRII